MKEKITPKPEETQTQDAQLLAESMSEDPKMTLETDFEDDYKLAQEMSHSSSDSDSEKSSEKAAR